jgi:hypothetical protein
MMRTKEMPWEPGHKQTEAPKRRRKAQETPDPNQLSLFPDLTPTQAPVALQATPAPAPEIPNGPVKRAGTAFHDPKSLQPVYGPIKGGGRAIHGHLDRRSRIYQTQGEYRKFSWFIRETNTVVLTMAKDVWDKIMGVCSYIEIIDNVKNECYRCDIGKAIKNHVAYDGGFGIRIGIPKACFNKVDGDGNLLEKASR